MISQQNINRLALFANCICNHIQPGIAIHLYGELGAGKTTFASMLINTINNKYNISNNSNNSTNNTNIDCNAHLSINKNMETININTSTNKDIDTISLTKQITVTSPTFNIVNQYTINDDIEVYHFDLYRIKNINELKFIGLDDAVSDGVSIVEWPEIAKNHWKRKNIIEIHMSLSINNINTITSPDIALLN